MPPTPSSLPPSPSSAGLLDSSSDTPCQPHLPFRFPVHCLHWSRHSLSPPCPFHPPCVLQTSVGPGLLISSAFYTPPALNYPPPPPPPHTHTHTHSPTPTPPLYLTHKTKTPPTLTHWWFSTWGAQPRHPTDGSLPLHAPTHQFASTNPLTKHTLHTYLNTRHEDTWYRHSNSATII